MKAFKLEQYFAEFEFTAKHLLSSSDCEPLSQSELIGLADEETRSLWNELRLSYTESQGHPILRTEIAKLYNGITPDQVLVLAPEEGIYLVMNTLLSGSEEVICTFPGYQSLYQIAEDKGCNIKYWKPDHNNLFSVNTLLHLVTDKTRFLVMNFPHNPTGAYPSVEEFQHIIELCRTKNILLFSDEMYRGLELSESDKLPSVADVCEQSIVLSGMSKTYSLPGLRIGWLIIQDPDQYREIEDYKHYTTICPPGPSEILAIMGLRAKQEIIQRNLSTIKKNIGLVEEFSEAFKSTIRWIPPKAGSIAFPELLLEKDIEKFCRCLVDRTGVMILPGSVYDYPGRHFRLGLGRKDFETGLHLFGEFLSK